ncbi:MAG TPA: histidine phosphatase family protein [Pseudonocardiaceae bacterium]|jgi:phosphohistidine phosphatase|nr:histidine phosphatase family protein [Pseudonocardiaceae bacterium]
MRTLVVLRHAKSAWPEGTDDRERPLADRGRRDAPAAGRWLRGRVPVDLVVCSPALRTRQTWDLVAAELDGTPEFRVDDRVYDAFVEELVDVVRDLPATAENVLLIGHNPGLTELVHELSGSDFSLKTSSIAILRGHGEWSDAGANWLRLVETETPRGSGE